MRGVLALGCRMELTRVILCLVDVPMSRVKFNVNTEYAYLQNFKVLQSMSTRQSAKGPL